MTSPNDSTSPPPPHLFRLTAAQGPDVYVGDYSDPAAVAADIESHLRNGSEKISVEAFERGDGLVLQDVVIHYDVPPSLPLRIVAEQEEGDRLILQVEDAFDLGEPLPTPTVVEPERRRDPHAASGTTDARIDRAQSAIADLIRMVHDLEVQVDDLHDKRTNGEEELGARIERTEEALSALVDVQRHRHEAQARSFRVLDGRIETLADRLAAVVVRMTMERPLDGPQIDPAASSAPSAPNPPSASLQPGTVIRHRDGSTRTLDQRKPDATGWVLLEGGGLNDNIFDAPDGDWTVWEIEQTP